MGMSLNLKIGIRAQIFLDYAFMYQCWSLQLHCRHRYPSGEILGRCFGLLQSHCRSWVSWVGEVVVRDAFCKSLCQCPQQSQESLAFFHALLCSLSVSVKG